MHGYKSLEKTFIYQHLNNSNGITKAVVSALKKGTMLSKANMEEAFLIINKNFKFPLKYKVLDAIDNGGIRMVFAPHGDRLPTCMPFFLTKGRDNRVVAVVLIDTYGRIDDETKNVAIDPKKLYCLLESAYLAKVYYHHVSEVYKRTTIIKSGSAIYANMFSRVLNKKYALNVDKIKHHKILFLASKFFLINILGLPDNDITANYAMKNCLGGNPYILQEVNDAVDTEAYENLSTFIEALTLPVLSLGMSDLTVRGYLEQFINMYDASALLALEYFPYFVYNVISVVDGAYINNQYILEDIVDKDGAKIYQDLITVDRDGD